jgi:hypothetical protein
MSANNEERNLKILKRVVVGMGVLLVVGTIALFIAVILRSGNKSKEVYKSSAKETVGCTYKDVAIKADGDVISATTNNNILTITTKKSVWVYDLCLGDILSKITFVE